MKRQDATRHAANAPLLKSVARLPKMMMHGDRPAKSVRSFTHKGHTISILTTYEVKIDGRRANIPLTVSEDGQVQSHAIPNYSLSSAVDVLKTIIDYFPEDFTKAKRGKIGGGRHGGHAKGHHGG
jgi:hypothetical protein